MSHPHAPGPIPVCAKLPGAEGTWSQLPPRGEGLSLWGVGKPLPLPPASHPSLQPCSAQPAPAAWNLPETDDTAQSWVLIGRAGGLLGFKAEWKLPGESPENSGAFPRMFAPEVFSDVFLLPLTVLATESFSFP